MKYLLLATPFITLAVLYLRNQLKQPQYFSINVHEEVGR